MLLLACGGRPPSVVLVTLDTTRADHLSAYGYHRDTSPQLERFARESVRYTRAWSTSTWTLPSHASLFTGLYPAQHGAHFDEEAHPLGGGMRASALDARFETLAELLAARGYATAAIVSGPWLRRETGVLQGFSRVWDGVPRDGRPAAETTRLALAWLDAVGSEKPIFLFVNYFDPHFPYAPRPPFDRYARGDAAVSGRRLLQAMGGIVELSPAERAGLVDRYDGEIRAMDYELGRLLDGLRSRPDWEDALVIITADHGESFGEGGRYLHNTHLAEEQLRVPLLVRSPRGRAAGRDEAAPVQLVDLPALVARAVGFALPAGWESRLPGEREVAFAELYHNVLHRDRWQGRFDRDLAAAIRWPLKLVEATPGGQHVYRLEDGEQHEVESVDPAALRELAADLASRPRPAPGAGRPVPLDEPMRESLRALGYAD